MVARTVPLRCWWCARRPADRQERFPPKACAIVAVKRTVWCCDDSCMFEAHDTCINLACSMPQDHQHVVVCVIGVECVKVVSFFFNAVCSCVGHMFVWTGFIQRCRRSLMFPSPTTYSKQLQWRTVLFRMAKRMVVGARVVPLTCRRAGVNDTYDAAQCIHLFFLATRCSRQIPMFCVRAISIARWRATLSVC